MNDTATWIVPRRAIEKYLSRIWRAFLGSTSWITSNDVGTNPTLFFFKFRLWSFLNFLDPLLVSLPMTVEQPVIFCFSIYLILETNLESIDHCRIVNNSILGENMLQLIEINTRFHYQLKFSYNMLIFVTHIQVRYLLNK